jgi:hypothetical protein
MKSKDSASVSASCDSDAGTLRRRRSLKCIDPNSGSAFSVPSGHNPLVSRTTTIRGTYAQPVASQLGPKRKKIALSPVN